MQQESTSFNTSSATEPKDPELWKIAQKRASFKSHFTVYIIMNVFFWVLWYFNDNTNAGNDRFPWPVWPMLGWGIGVIFHYLGAYVYPKDNSVEREYQKLKNRQSNSNN